MKERLEKRKRDKVDKEVKNDIKIKFVEMRPISVAIFSTPWVCCGNAMVSSPLCRLDEMEIHVARKLLLVMYLLSSRFPSILEAHLCFDPVVVKFAAAKCQLAWQDMMGGPNI